MLCQALPSDPMKQDEKPWPPSKRYALVADTSGRAQDAEQPAAREPTGTAPKPTVDVEQLPYEQLTALETPETDAQVCCKCEDTCTPEWCFQTALGSASVLGQFTYQAMVVQAALADIGSADWAIACRGLLNIRRLSKHHTKECRALL